MEALDTYDDACLPVPAPASGVVAGDPNQRQRFYVELAPGETTVVSWRELVREAKKGAVSVNSADKTLVPEANNQVASVDSSDKALVQEPNTEVVSSDSPDNYPVVRLYSYFFLLLFL